MSSERIVLLTRMGVGVFDLKWWNARLRLFDAVTAASVSRMRDLNIGWSLILDSDVPRSVVDDIHDIVERHELGGVVALSFVPDSASIPSGMRQALLEQTRSDRTVHFQLIDDDDATSRDLFATHRERFSKRQSSIQVASSVDGLAVNAFELTAATSRRVSYPVNTTFFGKPASILDAVRASHTKWLQRAEQIGGTAHRVEGGEAQWLYLVHKQGDGDYSRRATEIHDARDAREVNAADLAKFGIDYHYFVEATKSVAMLPETLGLTWRRTQSQMHRMRKLKREVGKLKREMINVNSSIYDRSVPFFYLLKPLPDADVVAGRVVFKGVGTPGTTIEFWLAGRGEFSRRAATECDSVSGVWEISIKFAPAIWRVEFRQTDGVGVLNSISYSMTARSAS